MKIFAFAIGASDRASSRWRVWDHVEWLSAQGHEVRVDSLAAPGVKSADRAFLKRFLLRYPRWLRDFLWSDAVLIQEAIELWPAALFKNLGKRRQLVFDFSDPIDRGGTGLKRALRQWMFNLFVRRADAVVVENEAYIDLLTAHRDKCSHFYGPVDARSFREIGNRIRREGTKNRPLRIGWTGSHGTIGFIAPLFPLIDELAREQPIEVVLVGIKSLDHTFEFASLTLVPFDHTADLRTVPSFDLGLFRLEDDEDALWRGAGKLFIYMAAGVPFIATDRGIASGLMRRAKVGFPVAREADWPEVLRQAVNDVEARREMIDRSLDFAQDNISYDLYRLALLGHLTAGSSPGADR